MVDCLKVQTDQVADTHKVNVGMELVHSRHKVDSRKGSHKERAACRFVVACERAVAAALERACRWICRHSLAEMHLDLVVVGKQPAIVRRLHLGIHHSRTINKVISTPHIFVHGNVQVKTHSAIGPVAAAYHTCASSLAVRKDLGSVVGLREAN